MERHEQRIRSMKPTLKNQRPTEYKHLQTKPKRTQMIEDRHIEIERDNKILLDRMTNILQSRS